VSLLAWMVGPEKFEEAIRKLKQQRDLLPQTVHGEVMRSIGRRKKDPEQWARTHRRAVRSVEQRLLSYYQGVIASRLEMIRDMADY
jgi:DNA-binding transcriptional MocR family regulator